VINLLCDRALLAGYAEQKAQIDRRLVLRAARELRPARPLARARAWLGLGAASLLALAVALVALISTARRDLAEDVASAGDATPPPVTAAAPPVAAATPRSPAAIIDGDLEPMLELRSPAEGRAAALEAALAAWGLPPDGAAELDFEDLQERLAVRRLELLKILPDLDSLRRAATPANVALRDARGTAHYALLRTLSSDHAYLDGVLRAGTLRVSTRDLMSHLDGEVYAVWRDFEALPEVLAVGASGDAVTWLQSALAELGFYTAAVQGRFDETTRDAVSLFQKLRGLPSDGIVDVHTQRSLYEALPRYSTPNLDSDPVDLAHTSSAVSPQPR
jgi:general secretion pathway protein A